MDEYRIIMNIDEFNYHEAYRIYETKVDGIEIFIPESEFSDVTIALTKEVVRTYPQKIAEIVAYIDSVSEMDDDLKQLFTDLLHKPRIQMNKTGGILYYSGNALDWNNLNNMGTSLDWIALVGDEYLLCMLLGTETVISFNFEGVLEKFCGLASNSDRCRRKYSSVTIRKLPAMFVGSTSIDGVYLLIFDVIEEMICNNKLVDCHIRVNLLEDSMLLIGCDSVEHLHSDYVDWLKVVTALSDVCEVSTRNETSIYSKGNLISKTQNKDSNSAGMELLFKADKELFTYEKIEYNMLYCRLKELAQLNEHLSFYLTDGKNVAFLHFSGGLGTMLNENRDISHITHNEPLSIQFVENEIAVSVSMAYGYAANVKLSYVNNLRTYDGGTHVQGLYNGIFSAFRKYINSHMDETMVLEEKDIVKRLNFVIHVKVKHPRFMGAVKRELGNSEVRLAVENGIEQHLYEILISDASFLTDSGAVYRTAR